MPKYPGTGYGLVEIPGVRVRVPLVPGCGLVHTKGTVTTNGTVDFSCKVGLSLTSCAGLFLQRLMAGAVDNELLP